MSEGLSEATKQEIREFEKELKNTISAERLKESMKVRGEIMERLLYNGKLSLDEISEAINLSTRIIRDLAAMALFEQGRLSFDEIAKFCDLPREEVQMLAAKHLLSQSNIFEKIADACDLPLEKVQALAATK